MSDEKMKILERVANEKVEWKRLGEVCISITTGLNPRKNFKLDDEKEGELNCWYVTTKDYSINEKIEFVKGKTARITEKARALINKRSKLEIYDILFSAVGTVGKVAFVDIEPQNFDVNESTFILKTNKDMILPKYLLYYLRSNDFQSNVRRFLKGGTLSGIRKNELENIQIPIPSLELQGEIVRILDTFTSYIDEITKERDLREKQYSYYRDMMLDEEYLRKIGEKYFLEKEYPLRYTTLGEVGKFTRGNGLQKKDFLESGYPVVHYGEIFTKYGFLATKTFSYASYEIFSKLRKAKPKDILIATTSENEKDVGKCVVWEGSEEIGFSGDMYSYSTQENSRYIAYFFQTYVFQKQKERKLSGTKLIRLHSDDMEKIKITLPPLIIQQKVVEVLDKFRELSDEVTGLLPLEIEQRQKQYEYYREKLLNFGTEFAQSINQSIVNGIIPRDYLETLVEACKLVGVEVVEIVEEKLEDIFEIRNGYTPSKRNEEYWTNGTINWFRMDDIRENGRILESSLQKVNEIGVKGGKLFSKNSIIISTSATIGEHALITEPFLANQRFTVLSPKESWKEKINMKYMFYYSFLLSEFCLKNLTKSSFASVDMDKFKSFKILLPPLEVQKHVVDILGKFYTISNDLKEGLPYEIDLRQKQYEYYREKLLDFRR